ncbi:hypothetical protein [Nocardia sp. NPDC050710]|uniref:hypothetical protein n=1 Tax=Nocardia sp. NPDC050710 TaxID=3157220 RepID=UPI0033DDE85C
MPINDDWKWLEELPSWEIPEELEGPTNVTAHNIAIKLLSCGILGLETNVLIGNYIAEEARFNIWFLTNAKQSGTARDLLGLVSMYDQLDREVYEAWKRLERCLSMEISDEERKIQISAAKEAISSALDNAIETMRRTRTSEAR